MPSDASVTLRRMSDEHHNDIEQERALTELEAEIDLASWLERAPWIERFAPKAERMAHGEAGRKLLIKLDPEVRAGGAGEERYEPAWKRATALAEDEDRPTPDVTCDGEGESLIDYFTPVTRARVIAARCAPPARTRPRARRRREGARRHNSTRGAPPGDPEEPEPAVGRQQTPGAIIARLRVERGFSQEKAGVLAGLTQSGWSRIESDSRVARPRARAEIAEVLGVRVSEIWPS